MCLLDLKSQMILNRGRLQQSIEIWQTYQQATRKGTDDWFEATVLLSRQLQQAGRHKDALRLVNEVLEGKLEEDIDAGILLDAAKCHIGMGNNAEAKKFIDEARSTSSKLAESERRGDRKMFERIEAQIAVLLEKLTKK